MLDRLRALSAEAVLPAMVILCREFWFPDCARYLAGRRVGMPVSRLAKWKSVISDDRIGVLIVGMPAWIYAGTAIGETLLWDRRVKNLVRL